MGGIISPAISYIVPWFIYVNHLRFCSLQKWPVRTKCPLTTYSVLGSLHCSVGKMILSSDWFGQVVLFNFADLGPSNVRESDCSKLSGCETPIPAREFYWIWGQKQRVGKTSKRLPGTDSKNKSLLLANHPISGSPLPCAPPGLKEQEKALAPNHH